VEPRRASGLHYRWRFGTSSRRRARFTDTFDARGDPVTLEATGFYRRSSEIGSGYFQQSTIDFLNVVGNRAYISGVITESAFPPEIGSWVFTLVEDHTASGEPTGSPVSSKALPVTN
jgi:hypothetical protein